MNKGLKGLIGNNFFVYINDIIVYGKRVYGKSLLKNKPMLKEN